MTLYFRRLTACFVLLGVASCAQPTPPATATGPATANQPTASTGLACLQNPNYATMPLPPSGNRGRVAQWMARSDGSGCHWTRAPS